MLIFERTSSGSCFESGNYVRFVLVKLTSDKGCFVFDTFGFEFGTFRILKGQNISDNELNFNA